MSQVINEAAVLSSDRGSLPLLADMQYLEPYTSSALNRKFKGILRAGIYTGFQAKAGTGLSVMITSSSENDGQGAASINVGKNQISIQQVKDVLVPVPASKTSIIALEANFEFGKATNQVNASSTIKAAHIIVIDVSQGISDNQLELCRVNVPMDAKAVTDAMIDTSHRVAQTVGITLSEKTNSDEEGIAANSKAINQLRKELLGNTGKLVNDAKNIADSANINANGRVPSGRTVNGKPLSGDIALTAGDVGAYSKGETYNRGEIDGRVNDVRNVVNNANNNANNRLEKSKNGADIPDKNAFINNLGLVEVRDKARNAVPSGRRVNGKPLAGDISLTAADVGAYSRGEVDARVNDAKNASKSYSISGMRLSNCRFTSLDRSTINEYVNGHLWWRGAKGKVIAPYNDSGRLKGEIFLNIYHHDNNGSRGNNAVVWTQKQFASLQYFINGQWVNIADDEYKITNLDTASNPPR